MYFSSVFLRRHEGWSGAGAMQSLLCVDSANSRFSPMDNGERGESDDEHDGDKVVDEGDGDKDIDESDGKRDKSGDDNEDVDEENDCREDDGDEDED